MDALRIANERRKQDALVKRLFTNGKLDALAAIAGKLDDPEVAAEVEAVISRWPLDKVLRAVPKIGPARAYEILTVFRAPPSVRLRALSYERRSQLAHLAAEARELRV
jgi:hypothetical protein